MTVFEIHLDLDQITPIDSLSSDIYARFFHGDWCITFEEMDKNALFPNINRSCKKFLDPTLDLDQH